MNVVERVVPLELGVTWEPNAPRATLRSSDLGNACLTLKAHPDDHDQRDVVITFDRCRAAAQLPFNDEAMHLHPLYARGLREVLWAGEVLDSTWLPSRRASSRHFVFPLKECVVELLAGGLDVSRSPEQGPEP
jgi:hypothetical protein